MPDETPTPPSRRVRAAALVTTERAVTGLAILGATGAVLFGWFHGAIAVNSTSGAACAVELSAAEVRVEMLTDSLEQVRETCRTALESCTP